MARPRKPTAVKKLQGTLQPCRTNFNEPVINCDIKTIEAPMWLNTVARQNWEFAVAQMPEGMLTTLDFSVFAMWADTLSKILELEAVIQHEGLLVIDEKKGTRVVNPVVKTQNELKSILKQYITELGFTPASRSKVSIKKKTEESTNGFIDL